MKLHGSSATNCSSASVAVRSCSSASRAAAICADACAPKASATVMCGCSPILGGRFTAARLVTRIYFPEEEAANAADPVLSSLPATAASETLIATKSDDGYTFDVHLQGENETVFFSV